VSSTIHHHREGAGAPLVLLHGVGQSWQTWRPVLPSLAAEFDVLACDTPGFGRSPPLPAPARPTIGACTEAFRRFFAELGLGRPHVAGISMGGAIALELARAGAVASVCAISPAGFWTPRERRFCQLSLRAVADTPAVARPLIRALSRTDAGRTVLYRQLLGWPARMPAADAITALEVAWSAPSFGAALDAFDEYTFGAGEELRGLPVTVAWGVRDHLLIYSRQAPRARAVLPWARHVALGGGHIPCFDDPGAVAEVVRASTKASPSRATSVASSSA
jgi:pimeloyl-ACP methyl ester carboxylesterase